MTKMILRKCVINAPEEPKGLKEVERVIVSRIQILLPLLLDDNGIDKVKNMKGYERIRIMEVNSGKKNRSDNNN